MEPIVHAPPLTRENAMRILRTREAELRALGVARLALFGSIARGDAHLDSDIDVMIDVAPGRRFSLMDLAGVRLFLSDLLGRETDVVIQEDLKPRFRERIADDLVPVF